MTIKLETTDPMGDVQTTIRPDTLCLTTKWPTGGSRIVYVERDMDLSVNVHAGGTRTDGRPLRYDPQAGYVLALLGVDEDHDQVHVQPGHEQGGDMIETLQATIEALQVSLDALRKVHTLRV